MIDDVIAKWHLHMRGQLEGGLDALLADDVVFFSPIVFTPQRGKEITKLYLLAAGVALPGEATELAADKEKKFRYTKTILDHPHAILEFETSIDEKYVNGIDMITCNENDEISEFRVMIRPLQAINLVHRQMGETLERMSPPTAPAS
jgi:hypothetical protein